MNAASIHDTLLVEKFQVARDENSILLQGSRANDLRVARVRNVAVDVLLVEHLGQFVKILVDNEAMSLPHGGLEFVIGEKRDVVGLTLSSI